MTRRTADGITIIEAEPAGRCAMCGTEAELRPYGPGGLRVCFSCAMLDEAEARRQAAKYMFGTEAE